MRLLLIVKENDLAIAIKHIIRSMSQTINIDFTTTFLEATDLLRKNQYDVVLFDDDLSVRKSITKISEHIKRLSKESKVVFMISPDSDPESFSMADKVIKKPFTLSNITKEISDALTKN